MPRDQVEAQIGHHDAVAPEGYPDYFDVALGAAMDWQRARLTRQLHWEECEADILRRCDERKVSKNAATQASRQMEESMRMLESYQPRSAIGARKVLEVATEIALLKESEPDCDWYEGDIAKLLINVRRALEHLDGATRIGDAVGEA